MGATGLGEAWPIYTQEMQPDADNRRITSGGLRYPCYAPAAFSVLIPLTPHLPLISGPPLQLPHDHTIAHTLAAFPAAFLSKALSALQQFSLRELNLLRPQQEATDILWGETNLHLLTLCTTAYLKCCGHFDKTDRPLSTSLVVADFFHSSYRPGASEGHFAWMSGIHSSCMCGSCRETYAGLQL